MLINSGDLLRTLLAARIALVIECDDVGASADATQLEMAVLNMGVNARDAIRDHGQMTIGVTPSRVPGRIELRVADTGSGMNSS